MKQQTVVVASCSELKLGAARDVFPDATVRGVNVESSVAEQPVGREMTLLGAKNRLERAREALGDASVFVVSFENGMYEGDDGHWYDAAAVMLLEASSGALVSCWSEAVCICREKPHCRVACGTAVSPGEHGRWSSVNDPHLVLTGRSRREYLAETLREALKELQETK